MSARAMSWSIGLFVTAGLLVTLGLDKASRGLVIPSALLGLAISALIAEITSLRSLVMNPKRSAPTLGARPADGVVDIVPMADVTGEPNPKSPRFRKYFGLIGNLGAPARVYKLTTMRPALLGRIALISMYIGRDGSSWTDEEIARGHASLEYVGLWIEREAIRYTAKVNIELVDTYFVVQDDEVDDIEVAFAEEGDDVGPMEAHASTKAIIAASRAAADLGFADIVDLMGKIDPKVVVDSRVWLLHVRRSGRSLAIPAVECEVEGIGLAVCYAKESSFPEPLVGPGRIDPTTVAHELLHLFGASDKYNVALQSFPREAVSHRDIMRLDFDQLSRMTIDPLTASEVGWEPIMMIGPSTKNARR